MDLNEWKQRLKKENPDLFASDIVKIIEEKTGAKYTIATIINYLNKGNELGLCHYNGKEENIKAHKEYMKGENSPNAKKVNPIKVIFGNMWIE